MIHQGACQVDRRRTTGHGHGQDVHGKSASGTFHNDFTGVLDQSLRADRAGDKGEEWDAHEAYPYSTHNGGGHLCTSFLTMMSADGTQKAVLCGVEEKGLGIV